MKLSILPALALTASCASAPAIPDKMLSGALERSQAVHDQCIDLLQGGRVFSNHDEYFSKKSGDQKVRTTLEIIKNDDDGHNGQECKCIYRIDVPTGVYELAQCSYSYTSYTTGGIVAARNSIFHGEESDGRSITAVNDGQESIRTEISADNSGCKVNDDRSPDPSKLASCDHFAAEALQSMHEIKEAICRRLKLEDIDDSGVPPLCSGGKVFAPAPGTNNNK